MDVILRESFDYIPKWNENRSLPKEKQTVIEFQFLSASDFSEMVTDGKFDAEKHWALKFKSIKNLNINGKPCTAMDIYKMKGLSDLYSELRDAYEEQSAIDKKK